MFPSPLHERLSSVVGQRSSRHIGDLTGTNHETVRRYLAGSAPSVEFLQAVCKAFGISGEWLLTGKGPMKAADIRHHALRDADAGELLTALASSVESLITRVDRLEQFVQHMDVRLRGLSTPALSPQEHDDGHAGAPPSDLNHAQVQAQGPRPRATPLAPPAPPAPPVPQAPVVSIPDRVLKLRDALAKRPHEDAR